MSGQHLGAPFAVVVKLFARMTVVKFEDGKVDGLESFLAEIIGMCSVERGNVVTSREKAKQIIKARGNIESPIAISKFGVHECESSMEK